MAPGFPRDAMEADWREGGRAEEQHFEARNQRKRAELSRADWREGGRAEEQHLGRLGRVARGPGSRGGTRRVRSRGDRGGGRAEE
jgi:hypothetical protein